MIRERSPRRFGPERWVTLRETGEHVQVEAWSTIASAYRVRSRKRGIFLVGERDLLELAAHPNAALGRDWTHCQAAQCGAPLTSDLLLCSHCKAAICTCGRCKCPRGAGVKKARKGIRKKTARAVR
jgi:hypothetical protein